MFLWFHHMERTAGEFLRFYDVKNSGKKCLFVRTRKYRKYLVVYDGAYLTVYKLNYTRGKYLYVEQLTDHSVKIGENNLLRLVYPSKLGFDRQTRLIYLFYVKVEHVFYREPLLGSSGRVVSDPVITCWSISNLISLLAG